MNLNKMLTTLQPEFHAYAWAVCRNEEDAKDLLQNAFYRAMTAANPPMDENKIKSWMFRIIRNLHIDEVRKNKVRMEYQTQQRRLEDVTHASSPDILKSLMFKMAFEKLPREKQEILYLVDVAGMKYNEVADIMDIPQGTVMSRISRARRELSGLINGERSTANQDKK